MKRKVAEKISNLVNNQLHLGAAIFLVALSVRVIFILTLEDRWYFYDTKHYDSAAQNLIKGEGFTLDYEFFGTNTYNLEPLYPIFLAANYALFGRIFLIVRIVQAAMGALVCVIVFLIGKQVFGVLPGVVAAGICVFYPHLIFISGLLYPEQLFTLLIATAVLFIVRFKSNKRIIFLASAAFFLGLASLAKGIIIVFYPVFGLWLVFIYYKVGIRHLLTLITVVFVVFIITLLPWTIRNYCAFGKLAPIRAHTNVILDEKYVDVDDSLLTQMLNKKISAGVFCKRYLKEFMRFWTPTLGRVRSESTFKNLKTDIISAVAAIPVMIFGIVGLCCSRGKYEEVVLFIILIFSFAFVYALFLAHVRYRIPIEPYIILLAGNGIVAVSQKFLPSKIREALKY